MNLLYHGLKKKKKHEYLTKIAGLRDYMTY